MKSARASRLYLFLAVCVMASSATATWWTGGLAMRLDRAAADRRSAPILPIGPPISPSILASQDLLFTNLHPGHRAITAAAAMLAASRLLFESGSVPPDAYVVAARFGRIRRTRSPITNYDNRLVWIVEVSGALSCGQCTASEQGFASYEVIDALSGVRLIEFQAPSR